MVNLSYEDKMGTRSLFEFFKKESPLIKRKEKSFQIPFNELGYNKPKFLGKVNGRSFMSSELLGSNGSVNND
jgi:hypothetical protein